LASATQQILQAPQKKTALIAVLHLIHTMAYGGVETALINWVRKIDPERFQVYVACFANPGETEQPFVQAAQRQGIQIIKIPWGRRKPLFKASRAVADLIRQKNIDILHTHNCYADCVGAIAAVRTPVKTIATVYVWGALGWKRNLIQFIDRCFLVCFDLVTAHCAYTYRRTLKMGFTPSRVKMLTCGFEVEEARISAEERIQRRQALGAEPSHIVLANIARFYSEKAQDFLLHAFVKIREMAPDARLWMVGSGPLEDDLRKLSTQLGLDSSVTFVGFVKDLISFLPLVDIQVNSSTTEGVPLAICSGMAAGLPIVATAVGGLPEVIRDGHTGLLVPAGDADAFIKSTLRLIRDERLRTDLGAAARRFMTEDYSLDVAVQRVQRVYYEVLGICA
jgi:glycosyltransferase involved in cell wall biosynthesis